MTPITYKEVSIMMKRYRIGDNCYWYEEGTQPACAVEDKLVKKAETKKADTSEDTTEVKAKVKIPSNKAKGVKAK